MYMRRKNSMSKYSNMKNVIDMTGFTEDKLLEIINDVSSLTNIVSMKNHFKYLKYYVNTYDRSKRTIDIVKDIKKYLSQNECVDMIKQTYINLCNSINRNKINISIFNDEYKKELSLIIHMCAMCGNNLSDSSNSCVCGYSTSKYKMTGYYNTNGAIYTNIPKNMITFLNNFSCKNINNIEPNYSQRLDNYFTQKGSLIGSQVSSMYNSNMDKITNGYTHLFMYEALSKCKFSKPKDNLYLYMYLYWDWDYIDISPDIIKICSELYNLFLFYRKQNNIKKIPIEFCTWWFLYNCGIITNVYYDYKQNKSNDRSSQNEYYSIMCEFSIINSIKIPSLE